MSILVTGGAGYVGSHCCKELAKAGYAAVAMDVYGEGKLTSDASMANMWMEQYLLIKTC